MPGPVRCRIIPHLPFSSPLIAQITRHNSIFFYILAITRLHSIFCAQNRAIAMKTGIHEGWGRGYLQDEVPNRDGSSLRHQPLATSHWFSCYAGRSNFSPRSFYA